MLRIILWIIAAYALGITATAIGGALSTGEDLGVRLSSMLILTTFTGALIAVLFKTRGAKNRNWKTPVTIIALIAVFGLGFSFGIAKNHDDSLTSAAHTQPEAQSIATPPSEAELLKLVNKERGKAGVQPLVLSSELNVSAQFKADDMANRGYYEHVDPSGKKNGVDKAFELTGSACSYISENMVKMNPDNNTSVEAVSSWLSSPSHKNAMLDATYTYTGFGINGALIVQHFCKPF